MMLTPYKWSAADLLFYQPAGEARIGTPEKKVYWVTEQSLDYIIKGGHV